ncbi:carboxylesterase [Aliihoeflea sp. 40Bstr573]|uniref:alpha/beta hydrolase n=1 Tax=Aliihoeflea sp. 40Bstr573 TaxID=2696467 RepID=UPI0020957800|nr:alpha/beta fold hydrolase [Aliihoeflea sp. 40Bstr573]
MAAKTKSAGGRWRMWLIGAAVLVLALCAIAYLAGPRVPVDTAIRFDPAAIGGDVEAYVDARERDVPNLRDGVGKEIVWAFPASKARTPLAIVYVHGFSASSGEIRPVPDEVAARLGANLFFTRLTGHGQDGGAMATASVNDWVNDYAEAIEIGRRLGTRVVVMATSTGAGLATWAATQPELSEDVAALVLVSPNYRVRATGSSLLTGPWGGQIARLASGPERQFTPRNEAHGRLWTARYPTEAILPMAALTKLARNAPAEEIGIPALFIYSSTDRIVDAEVTRDIAARWGALSDSLLIESSGDPQNHVIAGDALSPQTNELVIETTVNWLRENAL